jgi:hypothetical protein
MSDHKVDGGRSLAEQKGAELAALSWEELDSYEPRDEQVALPSGQTFRVNSKAYWDMDAWRSDMLVSVNVYALRGWRRYRPYTARALRGGEDLPEQPPPLL